MDIQEKRRRIRVKLKYISKAIDDDDNYFEDDFMKRLDTRYIDRMVNSVYEYIQNEHVIHLKK